MHIYSSRVTRILEISWDTGERTRLQSASSVLSFIFYFLFSNKCTQKHTNMCGGLVGTVSAVWMWSPLGLEGVFSDQQKQALQCNTHTQTNIKTLNLGNLLLFRNAAKSIRIKTFSVWCIYVDIVAEAFKAFPWHCLLFNHVLFLYYTFSSELDCHLLKTCFSINLDPDGKVAVENNQASIWLIPLSAQDIAYLSSLTLLQNPDVKHLCTSIFLP